MDAAERFSRYLATNRLRLTRERRGILEELLRIKGHFDADSLLVHFRSKGLPASRATLYRTLARLVDAGLVHKIEMEKGQAQYEVMVGRHHHDHMICVRCGRIVEFESREIERLQTEICRRKGFTMTGHMHQIRGHCSDCRDAAADGRRAPDGRGGPNGRGGRRV
ncbi:MAG TPA: transcriptional repressor [Candidatus Polarisedimenticolia bacterium]|nr:transcriptional repressor [Candidatus Polarisedimenticolia bacterium]